MKLFSDPMWDRYFQPQGSGLYTGAMKYSPGGPDNQAVPTSQTVSAELPAVAKNWRAALNAAIERFRAPAQVDEAKFNPPYVPKIDGSLQPETLVWWGLSSLSSAVAELDKFDDPAQGPPYYNSVNVPLVDICEWASREIVQGLTALAFAHEKGLDPLAPPAMYGLLIHALNYLNAWAVEAVKDAEARGLRDALRRFNANRGAIEKAIDLLAQGVDALKDLAKNVGPGVGVGFGAGLAVLVGLAFVFFGRKS